MDIIIDNHTNQITCLYHKAKVNAVAIDQDNHNQYIILDRFDNFAIDGDLVEITLLKAKDLKDYDIDKSLSYAKVVKIIKHKHNHLIGFLNRDKHGIVHLISSQARFSQYPIKVVGSIPQFEKEELFNCKVIQYPTKEHKYFKVEIVNLIGNLNEDSTFFNQLILEHQIPTEFSSAVLEELKAIPDEVKAAELTDRKDLRNLPFVTIDGIDAKDFDDAVYAKSLDNGKFKLYVAIADVANYVKDATFLEQEAYLRGTSIYFPKQVVPMLPEKISNGLCSLNPKVDRLVICCEMELDSDGKVVNYELYNGVINSYARLTYEEVQGYINKFSSCPSNLSENIANLYLVFKLLHDARERRGAIDFSSSETMFKFDESGLVEKIIPRNRLESHRLIEECMLCANVCVADFLLKNHHPGLFRNHDKPSLEKFNGLKLYLTSLGIKFEVEYEDLTPTDYAKLLKLTADREEFVVIEQTVLRSMQLAVYAPHNIGHFGLSYTHYLHFTSPIRRYPDLLTHRVIKQILKDQKYSPPYNLEVMGQQASYTERRAEDLERKMSAFYKCQYAKSHIGKEFVGIVTSVVSFGLFVYLPKLMLDGMLHVSELGKEYLIFDEKRQVLIGKRSGSIYRVGQEIKVVIAGVNLARQFIDFTVVKPSPDNKKVRKDR